MTLTKPDRYAPRPRIDYAAIDRELLLPKGRPFRSVMYRAFVRRHGCFIHCVQPVLHPRCAPVLGGKPLYECAHLGVRGIGSKSDDRLSVDLCRSLHQELHHLGQERFESKYAIRLDVRAGQLSEEWERRTERSRR